MDRLEGLDDAQWGALVAKGWDKLPNPGAAILASMNEAGTYRQQLTIPSDEIARIPKDPAAPEWNALYERLGKPKDPTAYALEDVKFADGTPLDPEDATFVRNLAHELHLSVPAAKQLAVKFAGFADTAEARQRAQTDARVGAEMAKLDTAWGGQKDTNMYLANQAMDALKLPEQVRAAFKGSADAMEAMRNLGTRLQEANYQGGGGGGAGRNDIRSMTADQARARIDELKRDQGWIGRWVGGGSEERQMLADLTRVSISGPQRQ